MPRGVFSTIGIHDPTPCSGSNASHLKLKKTIQCNFGSSLMVPFHIFMLVSNRLFVPGDAAPLTPGKECSFLWIGSYLDGSRRVRGKSDANDRYRKRLPNWKSFKDQLGEHADDMLFQEGGGERQFVSGHRGRASFHADALCTRIERGFRYRIL